MRFGTAAILGRANVGKSTLLNAALGTDLAIVSPRPQTTRDALLGIALRADAQIAFIDTPGLHRPRHELGRRMNLMALDAVRAADVVVFVTDRHRLEAPTERLGTSAPPLGSDLTLLQQIPESTPCVLLVSKVDQQKDKRALLPLMQALSELRPDAAVVPACLLDSADVERVLEEIVARLPEGPAAYDEDTLTNRPLSFFICEYVREAVMLLSDKEVVHAVAVSIDAIDQRPKLLHVSATIHVEKVGQRKILIGHGGSRIKQIGTAARQRIQGLVGQKVYLELFVRVTPRWKDMPRQLSELGYDAPDLERSAAQQLISKLSTEQRPKPASRAKSQPTGKGRSAGAKPRPGAKTPQQGAKTRPGAKPRPAGAKTRPAGAAKTRPAGAKPRPDAGRRGKHQGAAAGAGRRKPRGSNK